MSRFLAVVFPVSSLTLRTASNAKTLILATWVTITGCSVPIWVTHNVLKIDNGKCLDFQYVKYFTYSNKTKFSKLLAPTAWP